MPYPAIFAAVIVAVIVAAIIFNTKRNNAIKQNGIEAAAVVSRVKEDVSTDSDGMTTYSYTYYVTYRTQDGRDVEAQLGSGKSIDTHIGKKSWDSDLAVGVAVRIKYLPEKPNYVIRIE